MDCERILYSLSLIILLLIQGLVTVAIFSSIHQPLTGSKPLMENDNIRKNLRLDVKNNDVPSSNFGRNITGTYKGSWRLLNPTDSSPRFPYFWKSSGSYTFDIIIYPTKENGVYFIKGVINFDNAFNNRSREGNAHVKVEGLFKWPYKQLQVKITSDKDKGDEDDYLLLHPHHLLGVYASKAFQESFEAPPVYNIKDCNMGIRAKVSKDGNHDRYNMEGLIESPLVNDNRECFLPMLLNATSVETENYFKKATKYVLMVIVISLFEIRLLFIQMEHSGTRVGAASVSIVTICHQAIMDTYICILHVIAGYLVEPLFDWFVVATIFKFVVFSLYEMRFIVSIWHANRPINDERSWAEIMDALTTFHRNFYIILISGFFIMYVLKRFLPVTLLILHCFWIPQILTNAARNTIKPLLPLYIIGMSITRLLVPLYFFGCPHNFIHAKTQRTWCIYLAVSMALQASILLVQNYFGSRCFLPGQIFPARYNYYRRFNQDTREDPECVICISAIDTSWRSDDCMVTPCNHFFHCRCLQRWMGLKMECPTCRRPLPEP